MLPIIIVMLAAQAALILATIGAVVGARPGPSRVRPLWSSLALVQIIGAGTSFNIADHHRAADGSELLQYGSGVLLGMAILSLLVLLRQRMGADAVA